MPDSHQIKRPGEIIERPTCVTFPSKKTPVQVEIPSQYKYRDFLVYVDNSSCINITKCTDIFHEVQFTVHSETQQMIVTTRFKNLIFEPQTMCTFGTSVRAELHKKRKDRCVERQKICLVVSGAENVFEF